MLSNSWANNSSKTCIGPSKFIVHPNYKMKISRELVANVNFITATRVKDSAEFTLPKYRKI